MDASFLKNRSFWVQALSCLFILLFAFAGITKLLEGDFFYTNLRNAPLLEDGRMAIIASMTVPWAELIVALLLCWPKTRLAGLYGALGLFLLFAVYAGAILFFVPYRPCSCGGVITLLSWEQHLMLNGTGTILAIWGLFLTHKERKRWKPGPGPYPIQ